MLNIVFQKDSLQDILNITIECLQRYVESSLRVEDLFWCIQGSSKSYLVPIKTFHLQRFPDETKGLDQEWVFHREPHT